MAEISINLRADPAFYKAGVEDAKRATNAWEDSAGDSAEQVAKKLEEVIRTLVKLGTQSGKSRTDMVRDLRQFGLSAEQAEDAIEAVWDEMGEGQRAVRGVERAADAFDDVEEKADDAAKATKKVGDESDDLGGRFSELGDIARDVLEGDFASAAEGAVSALGSIGAFVGGGALGGIIGAGAASVVQIWLDAWQKGQQDSIEATNTWADQFIQANGRVLTEAQILENAMAYVKRGTDENAQAVKLAEGANVDLATAVRALAGDLDAAAIVNSSLNAEGDRMIAIANAAKVAEEDLTSAQVDALSTMSAARQVWNEHNGEVESGIGVMQTWRDVVSQGVTTAASDATTKVVGLQDAFNKLPPSVNIPVTADTSSAEEAVRRFTAGGRRLTVVADVVDRMGRTID